MAKAHRDFTFIFDQDIHEEDKMQWLLGGDEQIHSALSRKYRDLGRRVDAARILRKIKKTLEGYQDFLERWIQDKEGFVFSEKLNLSLRITRADEVLHRIFFLETQPCLETGRGMLG